MKQKALYILDDVDLIFGPEAQTEVARLVQVIAAPQTAQSISQNPGLLAEVDLILSGWGAPTLDDAFLEAAPNLKAFFYGAGSVRGFVTDAFWARQIKLTSAYAANAAPVSEYTLAAIFLSLKRFWRQTQFVKQKQRYPASKAEKTAGVAGGFQSTVGLISLGMIGRLVCQRLQPFDLKLIVYDPYVSQVDADQLGVKLVSLETLFQAADVVSLHTPWLPETEGMITGALLASMRPDATFINTARGAIVREAEMIEVLQSRPDLWAILDVVYPEPPAPESLLFTLPNVVLSPHIAGSLAHECRRMGQYIVAELHRYLAGEPLLWEVTEKKARLLA